MKFTKYDLIICLGLIIASAIGLRALASTPFIFTSHDLETHTARIANYFLALREGQFPPQLAPKLAGGLGFPIFVYIYPLPYLVGSFLHDIGLTLSTAAKIVLSASHLFGAPLMYLFLKLETKKTIPSLIGALFFTWAPYRFVQIVVRGALGESFAYLFIPLTLIGFNRMVETKKTLWTGLTAISIAGLLLSHQLVSVMFLPVFVWYLIGKGIYSKHKKRLIISSAVSIIVGFLVASLIYLPGLFEKEHLKFDQAIDYYLDQFVSPWQLVRSPWGYGFAHPGYHEDDVSFQIGLTQLSAIALATALIIFLAAKAVKNKTYKSIDQTTFNIAFWLIPFFITILIMTEHPVSITLWNYLPGLNIVDFPWRFLGVSVFTASMVVAYTMVKFKSNILLAAFFIFFVFYANRNHLRINLPYDFTDQYFYDYDATATWRAEFLPKIRYSSDRGNIVGESQVWTGNAEITVNSSSTTSMDLTVEANELTEIIIHRLYLPGWQVSIDGEPLEYGVGYRQAEELDPTRTVDYSGLMIVLVPEGTHSIQASYRNTNLRNIATILSLVGVVAAASLTIKGAIDYRKHSS